MNKNKIDALSHGVLLLAWIIGLIIIAVSVEAQIQPAKLRVQIAEGSRGYTCEEAKQVYKTVADTFQRELRVRFKSKIRCGTQPFIHTLADQTGSMVFDWHKLFKNRMQPMIVIRDMVEDFGGQWFTGGVAIIAYRIGVAFVGPKNHLGYDRSNYAYITIAHELGHAFGAYHDNDSANIMTWNALAFADQSLHFTDRSRREIRRTIRRDKKNKTWQRSIKKMEVCL